MKSKLRFFAGGEALSETLKRYFVSQKMNVWNMFGPTETTIWSTVQRIYENDPITIGKPISNTQIYIVDPNLKPTPVGVPGELCIAGDGLARGYLNKSELSAAKFIENPFHPGTRLYKTGDLARWLPDGKIEFIGRNDAQVKIHGFRIELGEIETLLQTYPLVLECVAGVKEQDGNKQLVGYYVSKDRQPIDPLRLREHLRAKLPDYMIPALFISLEALPLTPNGKVDRKALNNLEVEMKRYHQVQLPQSDTEAKVLEIWKTILKTDDISTVDGFFTLGGDSVLAVITAERIKKEFDCDFTVTSLFKYSNVKEISQFIADSRKSASSDATDLNEELSGSQRGEPGNSHPDYYEDSLAIIGISCQFPGANHYSEFWNNLRAGQESIRFFSKEELSQLGIPEELLQDPEYVPAQSTIEGKNLFDPAFFNLSPRDAQLMDPQMRLLLIHAWKAIEDAGYISKDIPETSVFISASNSYYQAYLDSFASGEANIMSNPDEFVSWMLAQGGSIPTMISYKLGLKGPSYFVHSNCSSSMVGLHSAFQSLRSNEAKYALVGAATIFSTSHPGYTYQPGLNFSGDGHVKAFDAAADGVIGGEGVAVIMLKKAMDAIHDGDHIYAFLRGIAVNNDGSDKVGFYAPSVKGQTDVIRKVLEKTQVHPESISYIEAHGTGTKLGDPIEFEALREVYRQYTSKLHYCGLGSVKTNIGHMDTAAGLAGCIKVALSLYHNEIPPSLNFQTPNSNIELEKSPFYVNTELKKWATSSGPRRAALNSLGVGGTNVHAIFEQYLSAEELAGKQIRLGNGELCVIPLSARNKTRLKEYAQALLEFLENSSMTYAGLANLAYTFQVGREPMDSRLALLVTDRREFIQMLEDYSAGKEPLANYFSGDAKQSRDFVRLFEKDEGLQTQVEQWYAAKNLEELARLWVKGVNLNWNRLYPESKPCRISLPTYPFAKDPYWLPERVLTPENSGNSRVSAMHPLVQKNTSVFSEQRFSSTFTGKEFFLADHVFKGQRILPGMAYLEMARAAVTAGLGVAVNQVMVDGKTMGIRLKNLTWNRPMVAGDHQLEVHIGLFERDNEEIGFEIYSVPDAYTNSDQTERVIYSQGIAALAILEPGSKLDIESWQKRCNRRTYSAQQCYDTYRAMGYSYGPGHKGMRRVYVGLGQALAQLELPAVIAHSGNQFVLHPSLMDSALQASVALLMSESEAENAPFKPGMPFALQEMEIYGACTNSMWALVRYSGGNSSGGTGRVQKLDLDLCDDAGNILVRLKGFSSLTLEEKPVSAGLEALLFRPAWRESVSGSENSVAYIKHRVFLCEMPEVEIEKITFGIRELAQDSRCEILDSPVPGLDTRFQAYTLRLLDEVREIIKAKPSGKVLVQIVVPNKGEKRVFSGLLGLLKTAQLENPRIIGQVLELDPNEDAAGIVSKLKANSCLPFQTKVRYQDNQRLVADWDEMNITSEAEQVPWKDGGVYLITGGTGGLGRIFAAEIIRKVHNVTLILTGRKTLDQTKQAQIEEWQAEGARIEYQTVDVTDREAVTRLIEWIGGHYGALNGIIHCAGIIQDNYIIKKTSNELSNVLRPKVAGLVNLDSASRDLPLDFLICFSSVAGPLGGLGQADYAAANAFMDAYAEYRNQLAVSTQGQRRIFSINWPLWSAGGMNVDRESQQMLLQSIGMAAMPTEIGLRAFYVGCGATSDQMMVVYGTAGRIRQKVRLNNDTQPVVLKQDDPVSENPLENQADNVLEKVKSVLFQAVSELIKVRIEDIDAETELNEYGFDSITLTQLANQLNRDYQLDLMPTVFFEHQTLESFAQYLVAEYSEVLVGQLGTEKTNSQRVANFTGLKAQTAIADSVLPGLMDIDPQGLVDKVKSVLFQAVSELIKVRIEDIDAETELNEYGFDSITLTQLANQLNRDYQLDLMPTVFFEHQTLESFAQYLVADYSEVLAGQLGTEMRAAVDDKEPEEFPVNRWVNQRWRPWSGRMGQVPATEPENQVKERVAIVGVSARFPMAQDINEFWRNLIEEKHCITEVPKTRWDWQEYYGDPAREANKTNIKWGGFIDGVDEFDPLFFGISPVEAESMDPQQRQLMMHVWKALEDAGISPSSLAGTKTAIFVGTADTGYSNLLSQANIPIQGYTATGTVPSVGPNRMSFFLNIHGPSEPVETACSSSLVAIHRAVCAIENGSCEMAIVGGVNTILTPNSHISYSKAGMLSQDGKCKTFSAQADGYVRGEGVGMIVLKKLQAAEADGNHIYAIIAGTAENHGGRANSLTAPNPRAQAELLKAAYTKAGIEPRTITYIEAHGTGTVLGDPIEINGLKAAFKELYQANGDETIQHNHCGIGSVKSNIGHLELAAGMAGVIKVLLQLKHKTLIKTLHCDEVNPYIKLNDSPFYIVRKTGQWKVLKDGDNREIPRRAGVSSFGFGGVNAHVVLEEYIPQDSGRHQIQNTPLSPAVVVLSARNDERLKEQAQQLLTAIKKPEFSDTSLADMSYTLQVGREAMEERVGFIVSSMSELEEKLEQFVNDWEDGNLYRGHAKRNQAILADSETDEAKMLSDWIANRKYAKLLELWVKGLAFDWNRLYAGDARPHCIPLPTYPFAKERYWIAENEAKAVNANSFIPATLHPLLHQNTSDLVEQRFTSTFTGQEFFLADHVVKGQRVLPGVAYLEMARVAVAQATGASAAKIIPIRLRNIIWARPIVVENGPFPVHIGLYPEGDRIQYEVYSQPTDASAEPIVHSQGIAVLNAVQDEAIPFLDLPALQASCTPSDLDAFRLYETFREMGMGYGSAHRGVEQLYLGPDQVLAKLVLPLSVTGTEDQFVLHPSLMDSAIQATLGLMGTSPCKLSLPFALEELEIFGKCSSVMWAHIRYSKGNHAGDKLQKLNIDLCDDQGQICVRFNSFTSKVLEGEPSGVNLGTLMLHPSWKEQPTLLEAKGLSYEQHRVLLCEMGAGIREAIEMQINGVRCLALHSEQESIAQRFQHYAAQVFEEIQSILKGKPTGKVLIQIVIPNQGEPQLLAGISGLLKTAQLENPKIIGQLIEIESEREKEDIAVKVRDNSRSSLDNHIRYQNNQRYVARWSELNVVPEAVKIPWKDHGVYLITGGAGGLGMIFAREIAHQVKDASLVLTGRSPLDTDKRMQLKQLKTLGVRVEYQQIDVTQKKAIDELIQGIQANYGSLHGIIHCAGIIKDNFILKKTKEEFQTVLAPKVTGLLNLDQASRDLNLEFFILFSSTTGAMGNPGQADYATANAFMDVYADYRNNLVAASKRYGRTFAVNWPLWQAGGMRVDAATEKMLKEEQGMVPLRTEVGVKSLYQGFASGQTQVLVAEGNLKQLRASLLETQDVRTETLKTPSHEAENEAATTIEQAWLSEQAENYFKKLLSSVIKLPASRIEADAPMEKYGIDSIMVMQLTNQVEKIFGSLSKTLFFEYQNIKELAGYFLKAHRAQLIALLGIGESSAPTRKYAEELLPDKEAVKVGANTNRRSRFATERLEWQTVKEPSAFDIAIIGLAGRYPGASNIREFWENLKEGRDCITEIPRERWDYNLYFDSDKGKPGTAYSKWGGFIEGVDRFDPLFFNISPREGEFMDPQERLFLQCVCETMEDAGYTRDMLGSYRGFGLEGNVGVYVGVMYEEYQLYGAQETIQGRPLTLPGSPASIANRVSYFCNFHGPSIALDTMCSSSLTAIHLACESLERGRCEMAIAGGVNVSIHPNKYLLLSQGKFVSSKGRCESFGLGGDGYVPGEGVGAVLLKPLSKARADGDHIYGVIKGTAINHGGKTNGYSVPNPNAQASVISVALKEAGIDPRLVSYIEAHGTGTSLGDPIEITGLTKAFQEHTKDTQYCAIGSAKSNIGHCESAAGIAGITKVLMQLKHGKLVPSLHSETLNPNINFNETPFFVQRELADWKRPVVTLDGKTREYPRIAGISSFGAGGANAHIVIEEYSADQKSVPAAVTPEKPAIIVLSAKNEERLKEYAGRLLEFIRTEQVDDADLLDIAYTLQSGREAMEERLAIIAVSLYQLEEKLQGYLDNQEGINDIYRGQSKRNNETMNFFAVDEELREAIDKWVQRGKYDKLLALWVKGLPFDWNKLYGNHKPRRISLPTYPFAQERYWAPVLAGESESLINRPEVKLKPSIIEETAKIILTKEWREKSITGKAAQLYGGIVVLGTPATMDLALALFKDTEVIKVWPVIHGDTVLTAGINTDYYSAAAGEALYRQIKAQQSTRHLLGVIDITAFDSEYEHSTEVESGKITFLQRLLENDRAEGYQLLQVTHQLQAFQVDQVTLEGARMVGLYRMLGAEYKQIKSMTMDSDCTLDTFKTLVSQIEAEFFNLNTENISECCYRNQVRYEPWLKISPTADDLKAAYSLKESYHPHDVILITGGSRGIGAAIAEHVVSQGVQNLVIMGREALPDSSEWQKIIVGKAEPQLVEKLKAMQLLVDRGARIRYYNTPLTDEAGIRTMLEGIHRELGRITGVFHCAGMVSQDPAFFKKTITAFEAVCEPKMKGLANLHRALADEPLAFLLLFSSVASLAPILSTGQSDYAMANAYMDCYALNQASAGKTYIKSIQWPAWGETGMAAGGARTPAYGKTGLVSLATADGLVFLDTIKRGTDIVSLPCVVVPSEFAAAQLLKTEVIPRSEIGLAVSRLNQSKPDVSPVTMQDLRISVIQWLKQVFNSELKLTLAQLDESKPFDEYGVESIMLAQLTQKLQAKVTQPLDPALLLEYSTLSALTDYFIANHAAELQVSCTSLVVEIPLSDDGVSAKETSLKPESSVYRTHLQSGAGNLEIDPVAARKVTEDIAIVGISCRFPGSSSKEAYWEVLTQGRSVIRPVPQERWIPRENRLDYGGWIDGVEQFDPKFFNLSEVDAAIMDPQARIILEESLQVIYDAGYEHQQLSGEKVGVYIGGRSQPNRNLNDVLSAPNPILGIGQNYLATNISRFFNFKGPSLVVDTACSSGITGMMLACDSLREGRINLGLVGAVSILESSYAHDLFATRNILSKSGEFHIFDRRSSGEVLGEGAGVVLLKRLSDAIKDGNQIYGVIKAIAENNDGQTLGPGSPNLNAQKQVMQEALRLSGKQPADIGYIEVNGGGSPVVDSIELKALSEVYNLGDQRLEPCVLGSVKPNIGHLLLTSGLAGFIRCVLSVYHKQIPPFLSALEQSTYYNFAASRIHFNRKTMEWMVEPDKKRLAALNSFPDGGTNSHLLVEEFVPEGSYQQRYFPRQAPELARKRFPLHSVSGAEPITATQKTDSSEKPAVMDMQSLKKIFNKNLGSQEQR